MSIEKSVFDASVIIAFPTPEKYSEWAENIFREVDEPISLDLVYYEVPTLYGKNIPSLNVLKNKMPMKH